MDAFTLPLIDDKATLSDAIDVLKRRRRTGLVVKHAAAPYVLDADLILHALRKRGDVRIGGLEPRVRTARASPGKSIRSLLGRDALKTQEQLDDEGAAYLVARMHHDEAEVVARHEPYGFLVNGQPDLWRCTVDSTHVWVVSDLHQPGNKCRYDGEPAVRI